MIQQFIFNPFQENTYILSDPETRQCVIVDPGMSNGAECQQLRQCIEQEGLIPVGVWLTHCHIDHELGTGFLAEQYGLTVSGPKGDYTGLPTPEMQAQMFGMPLSSRIEPVGQDIQEGTVLSIGQLKVEVRDIPGHSFHGLCYYLPSEKILLTGDVLFFHSIGRSDFGPMMGCDGEALVDGIRCKLLSLPADTMVYPGHGPCTTIASEIRSNPYF